MPDYSGSGAPSLGNLTATGSGTSTVPNYSGSGAPSLSALTAIGHGTSTGPGRTILEYVVFWNSGSGGPVDLVTPLAITASLSFVTAALAHPGDYTFLVRTHDTVTGWLDGNSDATVRLVLDAAGVNITNRPAPPTGLAATPIAAGGLRVEWSYLPVPGATLPTSFSVWCVVGAISYAVAPTATVSYDPGRIAFAVDVPSLTDGSTYTIGVRASNASGAETNTTTISAIADASGPSPVTALTAVPTY